MASTGKVVTYSLAAVGVVALGVIAAQKALEAIQKNISVDVGNPNIDMNTQPYNAVTGETYVRLDLPVTISNYNIFPLGARYFYGTIKYGNLTLTEVNLPYGLWVPSGGTVTITIDVDIPVRRVLDDIYYIAQNSNILDALINKVKLSGKLDLYGNMTNIPIPLNDIVIPIF